MAPNTLYPLFLLGHINAILLGWMQYKELKSAPSSPGAGKSMVMDLRVILYGQQMDQDIPNWT